jgi:membrane associated rhomboid family serine protease
MLVLGDKGHYHGRFPWVTLLLVLACVAVYTAQTRLGLAFTMGYSMVPAEITEYRDLTKVEYAKVAVPVGARRTYDTTGAETLHSDASVPIQHYPGPQPIFLTILSAMFMHASMAHLLGNMWFLLVFGRNVECALGHGLFLLLYLTCGAMAGAAHILSDPHSVIPYVGASGAISGILGAYLVIHPGNRITIWMGWVFDLPAVLVIGAWGVFQYVAIWQKLENPARADNVAYWAHVGGFLTGLSLLVMLVLILRSLQPRERRASRVPEQSEADPFAVALRSKP